MRAVTVFLQMYPQYWNSAWYTAGTRWLLSNVSIGKTTTVFFLQTDLSNHNIPFESAAFYRVSFNFGGVSSWSAEIQLSLKVQKRLTDSKQALIPKRHSSIQVWSELADNTYRYRYTRVTSAHTRHKHMDAHPSIKAYMRYKTRQEGMPQDLVLTWSFVTQNERYHRHRKHYKGVAIQYLKDKNQFVTLM